MGTLTQAPATGDATAKDDNDEAVPAAMLVPFGEAAISTHRQIGYDQTVVMSGSETALPTLEIPPVNGFLRGVWLVLDIEGAVGNVFSPDGPGAAIAAQLTDVNGTDIITRLTGDVLDTVSRWGGYQGRPYYSVIDPEGNTKVYIWVPVEVSEDDGFGALPNVSSAQTYRMDIVVRPFARVFTAGAGATVRVRAYHEQWIQPDAVDPSGRPVETTPPAVGSVNYHSVQTFNGRVGKQEFRLARTGYYLRSLFIFLRDPATTFRSEVGAPESWSLRKNETVLWSGDDDALRHRMASVATEVIDPVADLTGFRGFFWNFERDGRVGHEGRQGYLRTERIDNLTLSVELGAETTLHVVTNDVAYIGGA